MPLPAGVNELHFPQWKTGMGASIAFGVKQSPIPKLGYLIVLIDQWGLSTKLLQDFVAQWDARSAQISVEAEYSGPPVLFPTAMRENLIKLSGEKGAKKLIQSAHPRRITVSGASWDLDTETDLFLMQQLTQTDNNKEEPYDFT
jgi:molybdenum cofactor cytidylyltransferase